MARILGIDYGTVRVGFAVTDPLQLIVSPLNVVPEKEAIAFMRSYFSGEEVERIVCGLPGEQYEETRKAVEKFVAEVRKNFSAIPVVFQDEHFTSRKATDIILQSGARQKQRRDKSLVDKISAVVILQEYLGHSNDVYAT